MSKNQELHYKIKDLDLISKEFKHHSSCYKDFARGYSAKFRTDTSTQQNRLLGKLHLVKEHLISKIEKSLLKFMLFETMKLFQ